MGNRKMTQPKPMSFLSRISTRQLSPGNRLEKIEQRDLQTSGSDLKSCFHGIRYL